MDIKDPTTVSTGKVKQELVITDDTGSTLLTLWQEDINSLLNDNLYQLNRIQYRPWRGKAQLTFPSLVLVS